MPSLSFLSILFLKMIQALNALSIWFHFLNRQIIIHKIKNLHWLNIFLELNLFFLHLFDLAHSNWWCKEIITPPSRIYSGIQLRLFQFFIFKNHGFTVGLSQPISSFFLVLFIFFYFEYFMFFFILNFTDIVCGFLYIFFRNSWRHRWLSLWIKSFFLWHALGSLVLLNWSTIFKWISEIIVYLIID